MLDLIAFTRRQRQLSLSGAKTLFGSNPQYQRILFTR